MTNNINGIDVATNNNIYYSQKAVDELQNTIKRLQEENKRLQMLSCANCGEKYLSPDGAELYEKNVQLQKENEKQKELIKQLEDFIKSDGEIDHINHEYTYKLQKENEELKEKIESYNCNANCYKYKEANKYKQALEQIRKEYTNSIFYQCDKTEEECPCHNCIILGQLDRVQNIVKIIDEVLNDRN